MRRVRIRCGLDVAVEGRPDGVQITEGPPVRSVGILGRDLRGLRPRLRVGVGDHVALGDVLLEDRAWPTRVVTSPGSGVVSHIARGERRRLSNIVITLGGDEQRTFPSHDRGDLADLPRQQVVDRLLASGLWTALRRRPFSEVPLPGDVPAALFVTAMDTRPLALDVEAIVEDARQPFLDGLAVLGRLTEGPLYLCRAPGSEVPAGDERRASVMEFMGPHPAGLVGTHIHELHPVGRTRSAWYVGYQDAIAIGRLFTTGRLVVERIAGLAGPCVRRPRLVRTRQGASIDDLLQGELDGRPARRIAGCVLYGHEAVGTQAWLGLRQDTVAVIPQAAASLQGVPGPLVPVAAHSRVFPFDLPAVPLLRALLAGDIERAEALGCLELDAEDLALSTYICPSKSDYGALLRRTLETLAREGWA